MRAIPPQNRDRPASFSAFPDDEKTLPASRRRGASRGKSSGQTAAAMRWWRCTPGVSYKLCIPRSNQIHNALLLWSQGRLVSCFSTCTCHCLAICRCGSKPLVSTWYTGKGPYRGQEDNKLKVWITVLCITTSIDRIRNVIESEWVECIPLHQKRHQSEWDQG